MAHADDVRNFYSFLQRADVNGIEEWIDRHCAPDVVLSVPSSLPYGGAIEGTEAMRRFFRLGATATRPFVDIRALTVERMTASGDDVVAELRLTFAAPGAEPIPLRVMEWWRFGDGRLRTLEVFYEDSAICVDELRQAASPPT